MARAQVAARGGRLVVVLLLLLAAGVGRAAAQSAAADPSLGRDFHLGFSGWNGLSRLGGLARDLGCGLEVRHHLDWSSLDGNDVLLVLHPERPINPDHAVAFLAAGGRMVVADDFGSASSFYSRLGILRTTSPLPDGTQLYRQNPQLPVATAQRGTALGRSTAELVGNHSAYFSSSLPATFAFAAGAGLVVEGTLGHGRFVAIADPSIFINNMLEIAGNREFLARMVVELCRAHRDRLLLLTGPLSESGSPPAQLAGAPLEGTGAGIVEQWNHGLGSANQHIQATLQKPTESGLDTVSAVGLLFCMAALALLLRYLPMPVPLQDDSFAQPSRPPETGLFASIQRYSGEAAPARWGFVYPATLLREEVLTRLQPLLTNLPPLFGRSRGGSDPGPATPEQVGAELASRVSPRAGELATLLLREFRRLDRKREDSNHPSQAKIPERQLNRWYDLAVELFAELPPPTDKDRT